MHRLIAIRTIGLQCKLEAAGATCKLQNTGIDPYIKINGVRFLRIQKAERVVAILPAKPADDLFLHGGGERRYLTADPVKVQQP